MRKGDLVKLCADPDSRWWGRVKVYRRTTEDEVKRWENSSASKGMNSAGETKLPPQVRSVNYEDTDTWTVLRARCAPVLNYRKKPKCVQIMNNRTNEIGYAPRANVELV